MIRHIVLARFSPLTPHAAIDGVFTHLANLRDVIPGLLRFDAGANVSPEGLARGFTHAFVVDFETIAARDVYLSHPAHKAAGARLVETTEGGLDGILVIDIEIA